MNGLRVPILTRAYNERPSSSEAQPAIRAAGPAGKRAPREAAVSPFDENVLVFDTETTADVEQCLLFGTFRLYRDRALVEEGVFYADDLDRAMCDAPPRGRGHLLLLAQLLFCLVTHQCGHTRTY